ncbi:uncharacterized protein LOC117133586 [Brassica rapa]|uniref:uncharacterized protein LOC117133586 n=1 Tax=Brassica campestris TaxID=3711 RepID=UPI00142D2D02|nr:uncharacterized protein LOC117133586 [Brassica rapa]
MSPSKAEEVVQHIHPLTKVDGVGRYICDGCKTEGFGRTYRCSSCNYDLHEYCATCPPTLLSMYHAQHELRLIHDRRGCDICDETTDGLFYQCEPCGFDVHPLCTQQPPKVSHSTDQGEVQELIEVQELGEFQELGEVQEPREVQEPCEVQEPDEVEEPGEVEEPDPDRLRKRDVMYIGARVAWACMTGDVAGVISAFQL